MSIPQTNGDLEATGIILEAMSYEGMKKVTPEFYESLLKVKTARDNESAEMLDFIFGNISYDVGNMYNMGKIPGELGYNMSTNTKANISNIIAKNSNKWEREINKLVEGIENAD